MCEQIPLALKQFINTACANEKFEICEVLADAIKRKVKIQSNLCPLK